MICILMASIVLLATSMNASADEAVAPSVDAINACESSELSDADFIRGEPLHIGETFGAGAHVQGFASLRGNPGEFLFDELLGVANSKVIEASCLVGLDSFSPAALNSGQLLELGPSQLDIEQGLQDEDHPSAQVRFESTGDVTLTFASDGIGTVASSGQLALRGKMMAHGDLFFVRFIDQSYGQKRSFFLAGVRSPDDSITIIGARVLRKCVLSSDAAASCVDAR